MRKKIERAYYNLRYPNKEKVYPVLGMDMMIDFKNKGILGYIIKEGCYEREMTRMFREAVNPGMIVADIGANFGYYSLMAGELMNGTGMVLSFEPNLDSFTRLVGNCKRNKLTNVAPLRVALADTIGQVLLNGDPKNSSNASIVSENVTTGLNVEAVPTMQLDNFPLPNVIKIDVQGYEGRVLRGGEKAFAHADTVFMEIWPWGIENAGDSAYEILSTMERLGFRIRTAINPADEAILTMSSSEIVQYCKSTKEGKGHLNVVFVK